MRSRLIALTLPMVLAFGVALVAAIAERVEYAHVAGKNRISLVIPTPSDS